MPLRDKSAAFLDYLDAFMAQLPAVPLATVLAESGGPGGVAVITVDLIEGFATRGPLASARVQGIVPAVGRLLQRLDAAGVRHACVVQDAHPEDAAEFSQFPPHCIVGTAEAEAVPELKEFFRHAESLSPQLVRKNSISSDIESLRDWEERVRAEGVGTFIVVGDCTDLCVANLVLPLRTRANQENRALRIIVPADCVQTYDLSVDAARAVGALPHDGDLTHAIWLWHFALNGIEVVATLK